MYNFLQKNQGKISLKMAILGLALILVLTTSGISLVRLVKKATEDKELTIGLPIVFAAQEAPSFKVNLGQADLDTEAILAESTIDITGPENISNGQNYSQQDFEIILVLLGEGEYQLKIKPKKLTIKPGRYHVSAKFVTPQGIKDYSQDFYWGVLALNTNKSVYLPNEKAYIQMAVLTDEGNTICDADLTLKIKNEEIKVISNPACGPNNVIDSPDYYAYYQLDGPGIYQVELIAETINGQRAIQDFIEVKKSVAFEVERIGPTRIYPLADYQMEFKIKANQDFQGEVIEKVPADFGIASFSWDQTTIINMSSKTNSPMTWSVNWQAGQTYQLSYTFDAPDISPEFYLLGPLSIGNWQEARHWQIAADAVNEYDYTPNTACTDAFGGVWTTVTNACNSTNDDYASYDVPGLENDSSKHILADDNAAPANDGIISVVEIGVECHSEKSVNSTVHLIPVFDGTTDGTGTYNFLNVNTADDGVTQYFAITTDINGPGDGNWEWSDIENLDVKVYSSNSHGSQGRFIYIDQIRVRVTHALANYSPVVDSVTDSPDPVSAGQTVTFSVDWSDPNGGGEQVKAKICKTEGLTNQNCDGGYWATTSPDFVSSDPVNETYTTTMNDYGLHNYYAYVCDDGGLCSSFAFGTFGVGGVIRVKGDVRIKGSVRIKRY